MLTRILLLQLGLYLILFPSLGGMLLPALIIVPAHIIRYSLVLHAVRLLQSCTVLPCLHD